MKIHNSTNVKDQNQNGSQNREMRMINQPNLPSHHGMNSVLNSMGQKLSINLPQNSETVSHN